MAADLPVPIQVDGVTGGWSVNGVAMVLAPRHLITNILTAAESRIGSVDSAAMLRDAGRLSAEQWCAHEATRLQLSGVALVMHYLRQLSSRGWGLFSVARLENHFAIGSVRVQHSALAYRTVEPGATACYLFASWLEGALAHVPPGAERPGTAVVREVACAASGGSDCLFEITYHPRTSPRGQLAPSPTGEAS